MKKVTPLIFGLILVFFFNSCKKAALEETLEHRDMPKHPPTEDGRLAVNANTIVVGHDPSTVISGNLTVLGPAGGVYTLATQSEYNSMVYTDKIYLSGMQAAINYLLQSDANVSTELRYNIDASYSIVVNPTTTDEAALQCNYCERNSLGECMRQIEKYMKRNNLKEVKSIITRNQNGCYTIRYSFSSTIIPPVTTDGGTLVQTYIPSITNSYDEFESYTRRAYNWAPGPHIALDLCTRDMLISYIDSYNENTVHPVAPNQTNQVFQTQLAYYVYNIWVRKGPGYIPPPRR